MKIKTTPKDGASLAGTYTVQVTLTVDDVEQMKVGLQEYTLRPTAGTVNRWLKDAIEFDLENLITGGR